MRIVRLLRQRARSLFRGARVDAELASELAYHLEQLTRENIASGMVPAEARLAARRTLGGTAQIEEQCRDHRRIAWLTDLRKDLAFAWRVLRKAPAFTSLAVLTLALGVGASIVVYALSESLLLRSLPYPSPERLVAVGSVHSHRGSLESVGQENFRDWQSENTVFEHMAFTEFSQTTLTGFGDAERLTGTAVSEGFFEMLGVQPQIGRWFTADEEQPGRDRVIMLSYGFWVRKLGARPDAVGSTIYLNDRAYRITGVMPATFRFNEGRLSEYWTPIAYRTTGNRKQHQYGGYARLKPGVSIEAARAQMAQIARRQEKEFPDNAGWGVGVQSLRGELLETIGPAVEIFGLAALIVLLVGCANVASLLLARGVGRGKEIAVRIAMGAGRGRMVRLLLTESVLLSGLGALGGVAIAAWLIRLAVLAAPPWLQLGAMISVSATLVAFVIGLSVSTGVLTGLWPALRASRTNLHSDLKEAGSALVAGRRQHRSLHTLVVVEIALAVVLLTFAGLLARSFASLIQADVGYRTDHLLTFRMSPPSSRYKTDEARIRFWNTLLPKLAAIPGVVSAAAADGIPLGGTYSGVTVAVEGQTSSRDWTETVSRASSVTPSYFLTMGIPMRAGRGFGPLDDAGAERVAIVNQTFVRSFVQRDPLGKRVRLGNDWFRIVGVVGDHRYHGPASRPEAELYVPFAQDPWLEFVVLRTAVPEGAILSAVRKTLREADPRLAITQVRTMRESLDLSTSLQRELMMLVAGFAAITLGMATTGLAGVMAYAVSRRRREFGLRMALGARSGDISRGVILSAGRLILSGLAIGVPCAFAAARVLESLLYGVRPHDPVAAVTGPILLAAAALLACLVPARRAASVEPMDALRQE
jgi:putative ABC transport system permease protein